MMLHLRLGVGERAGAFPWAWIKCVVGSLPHSLEKEFIVGSVTCSELWVLWTLPEAIQLHAGGGCCTRKTPIGQENCQLWRMLITASLEKNSQALCKQWSQEMDGKQLEWAKQRGQPRESKRGPGSGPTPGSPAEVSWTCFTEEAVRGKWLCPGRSPCRLGPS